MFLGLPDWLGGLINIGHDPNLRAITESIKKIHRLTERERLKFLHQLCARRPSDPQTSPLGIGLEAPYAGLFAFTAPRADLADIDPIAPTDALRFDKALERPLIRHAFDNDSQRIPPLGHLEDLLDHDHRLASLGPPFED